jgi:hypothetical protein
MSGRAGMILRCVTVPLVATGLPLHLFWEMMGAALGNGQINFQNQKHIFIR